jgi:hypothetical protein
VFVSAPFTDANTVNNTAWTTLTASTVVPAKCVVPKLKGIKLKFAKHVIFGCTAGRVRHAHSRSVPRGEVIRTGPGAGTHTAGQKIYFRGLLRSEEAPPVARWRGAVGRRRASVDPRS